MGDQHPHRDEEALGEALDRGLVVARLAVGEAHAQRARGDGGDDVEEVPPPRPRAVRRAARLAGAGERRRRGQRLIDLAEVVEADLGRREPRERRAGGALAHVAEQPVAEAAARTARICSFTEVSARAGEAPGESSIKSGYTVVNHPTVRVTSTSGIVSSRPWPSTSTSVKCEPVHALIVWANAARSTSLICVWYASGTSRSSASVSCGVSARTTWRALASVFAPPS